MTERSYEIRDGRHEPRLHHNIGTAITQAVEDLPAGTVGKFGLDDVRFVEFTNQDRPRDVWERLMEKLNEEQT
uniref:Uncharacterized protein n=1 Tax=Pseudomonas phage HRDY3 TaxID=3236930 RepID=A0AB39CEN7_9VIRU